MPRLGRALGQSWSDYLRLLLSFAFGVVIIVHGVWLSTTAVVPQLVLGLLLMGIIPVDAVLRKLGLGGSPDATPSEPPAPADGTVTSGE